jgi:ribosomal protein L3 glutamine methyltransferase
MNVGQSVDWARARLDEAGVAFGHGTTNAHDEACWLVLWALGLPLHELDAVAQRNLSAAEQKKVERLIDQRIRTRKPAAYLTGEAWLQGVPFHVDERTIVPRSLIAELLADGSIDPWLGAQTRRVLDLCTGNGSLAVLAAMAYPDVTVDAADISTGALEVARKNVERHALAARVRLFHADLFAGLQGSRYDLILCNPPYVNAQSMKALPAEHRAEPAIALDGGADGMELVRRIVARAGHHLNPCGVLVLEIGNEFEHFIDRFGQLECVWLATSAGDEQVLLTTREALEDFAPA